MCKCNINERGRKSHLKTNNMKWVCKEGSTEKIIKRFHLENIKSNKRGRKDFFHWDFPYIKKEKKEEKLIEGKYVDMCKKGISSRDYSNIM